MVSLVSWGLKKARKYTSLSPEIVVLLEGEAEVACVGDKASHLRLQALLVDLSLYKVKWSCAPNLWRFGDEVAAREAVAADDVVEPPTMEHVEVVVKRKAARSYTVEDLTTT